jgi:hypothetical protein
VARSQAALLDEIALTLGARAPDPEEVAAWLGWAEHLAADIADASAAVRAIEQTRVLNPLALTAAKVHPALRSALDRLDRCLAAERALLVLMAKEGSERGDAAGMSAGELRRVFAVALDDLASGLRAFGDLIGAEYRGGEPERIETTERTLDAVREARAVLTELALLDIDPRERSDLWMLHGSVLAAVDHLLDQLDLERDEPVGVARAVLALPEARSEARTRLGARWRRRAVGAPRAPSRGAGEG